MSETRLVVEKDGVRYSFIDSSIDYVEVMVYHGKKDITAYRYPDKIQDGVAIISKSFMLSEIRRLFDMPFR